MKVLVTGATGFIGNHVVNQLLKKNCQVIATSATEQKAKLAPWFNKVKYIPFDFSSFDKTADYYNYFQAPDLMIHLAWEGLPNYKSAFHLEVNYPRHLAILTNLIKNGLKDLTVTGTCFEYGMQEGCLKEDMEVHPANAYAIAKNELRKSLEELQHEFEFIFKWVRLFYMYGPGQNPNSLIPKLEQALAAKEKIFNMSGGEQVRDFLPVETVASHIVNIALQKDVTGIINCASNQPVTVKKFIENYLQRSSQTIELNFGYYPYADYEPMAFWGDDTKLRTINKNEPL
jgi:dTDP-6-deoxy-L-talose 4-dehydrogenase (NAD+)